MFTGYIYIVMYEVNQNKHWTHCPLSVDLLSSSLCLSVRQSAGVERDLYARIVHLHFNTVMHCLSVSLFSSSLLLSRLVVYVGITDINARRQRRPSNIRRSTLFTLLKLTCNILMNIYKQTKIPMVNASLKSSSAFGINKIKIYSLLFLLIRGLAIK